MIRLGRISYVNMAPVFYGLEADVEEVVGVPTELHRMLLDGEIDIAPIPSIEYARNADRLRILPRLCVSSEGAVDSIQLVTRIPFGQIRSVAVTSESATSVVLVRILLPDAEIVPLGMEADATLLIGDAALRSAFEDPTPHFDLGRLWLERTGCPWCSRSGPHPSRSSTGSSSSSTRSSRPSASLAPSPSGSRSRRARRYGYPPGFMARYFEKLRYSFGPRERAGLYTFLEMARDVGELGARPRAALRARRGAGVTRRRAAVAERVDEVLEKALGGERISDDGRRRAPALAGSRGRGARRRTRSATG